MTRFSLRRLHLNYSKLVILKENVSYLAWKLTPVERGFTLHLHFELSDLRSQLHVPFLKLLVGYLLFFKFADELTIVLVFL
jgi:hypothetical protein